MEREWKQKEEEECNGIYEWKGTKKEKDEIGIEKWREGKRKRMKLEGKK